MLLLRICTYVLYIHTSTPLRTSHAVIHINTHQTTHVLWQTCYGWRRANAEYRQPQQTHTRAGESLANEFLVDVDCTFRVHHKHRTVHAVAGWPFYTNYLPVKTVSCMCIGLREVSHAKYEKRTLIRNIFNKLLISHSVCGKVDTFSSRVPWQDDTYRTEQNDQAIFRGSFYCTPIKRCNYPNGRINHTESI